MKVEEFLSAVKQGLQADSIQDADRIVRIVAGALKTALPDDAETALGRLLPTELKAGWEQVEPLPEELFEREDLYLEEGPPEREPAACPPLSSVE
ncbi:MAG: DUF2267 domain-containing protein [Candidatus Geothermincolia bacterium]